MSMRYKLLGRSGLRVSELCPGAMTFGDESSEGWGAPKEESRRILDGYARGLGKLHRYVRPNRRHETAGPACGHAPECWL
jgi:hypothetical protein